MTARPAHSLLLAYIASATMLSRTAVTAFLSRARSAAPPSLAARSISGSSLCFAKQGQAEVVLVGCGAPNRGTFDFVIDDKIVQVEDGAVGIWFSH
jgi:hypothetical protein